MKNIFIINPIAGLVDKTEEIREQLSKRYDIEAIVFNTEEAGHETALMKEMVDIFDDEDVRIYICGGSGTLSNAIDALDTKDMEHVQIGFYPCGLTNDILKNFVESGKNFENLNAVIDAKTAYIDYMRCTVDGDDKAVKNKLLFATVGVTANIERVSRAIKFLAGISPAFMYAICTVLSLPFSPSVEYEVLIDGVDYSREYKLIYVGNSLCMGGGFFPIKTDIDCRDGYLNVLFLKKLPALKVFSYLTEFMHGELPRRRVEDASVVKCKEISIRRKDGRPMLINADGEIFSNRSWNIRVVNNRMKFVVPKDTPFVDGPEEVIKCLGLC